MVAYGTGKVSQLCGYSISGCGKSMINVWPKYAVSKAHIQLKYGKSTVKYGKNIVLYGNYFLAPTVGISCL